MSRFMHPSSRILLALALFCLAASVWSGTASGEPQVPPKTFLAMIQKSGPGLVPLVPQCVECPKNISVMSGHALRYDLNHFPHIVFGSDHLYHTWYNGSTWTTETVDPSPGVGYYASIAFDSTGKPGICYMDSYNLTLKFARWTGTAWIIQTIDGPTSSKTYPTLLFDSSDKPMVSYIVDYLNNYSYQVKFARWSGSAWTIYPAVDQNTGSNVSLALDQAGQPHLAYFRDDNTRSGGLVYASWSGSAWTLQIVDPAYYKGNDNSLAFDSLNRPHISYYDDWDGLKYAHWNGSQWVLEMAWTGVTVDKVSSTSLVFAPGDIPMIAVTLGDSDLRLVWLVYKSSGGWVTSQAGEGRYPAIDLDLNNKPGISFFNPALGQLQFAQLTAWNANPDLNTWATANLDTGGQVGQGVKLAMDRFGRPHIAYMDLTGNQLKYATQVIGQWQTSTLSIPGINPAHGHAIAVDSLGKPHIAYSDFGVKQIKYASWTGSAWTVETVAGDPPGAADDIEKYISLALDAADNPHISYYNQHDLDLKYAHKVGAVWQVESVDNNPVGLTGVYNAIALDSSGKPWISYQDYYNNRLKVAHWNGTTWEKSVVDSDYGMGEYTSIVIDGLNRPHVCYSNYTYILKYAAFNGSTWDKLTLATASTGLPDDRNPVCSIQVGAGNVAYISFFDRPSRSLKLAHRSGTDWVIELVDGNGDAGEHNALSFFNGIPYLAYFHTSNKDLMFAQWRP